jgi:hypothetical protein
MKYTFYNRFDDNGELKPEAKIADKLTDLLNTSISLKRETGRALTTEHRYLQQEFWNVVEGFIVESAALYENGRYDGRNAYTIKMCAKINQVLDEFRVQIAEGK